MKRTAVFVILFLLISSKVFSAPIYGSHMPEARKIEIGGQTHYVGERKLEGESGEMNSLQHFLLVSYGITDWACLDLKGGAGNIKQKSDSRDEIVYPSYMGGGYGFRLKIIDRESYRAILGFQHISVHPYSIWIGETKHKAVLDDWQWSLLGSHSFKNLTPYLGIKWSRMDYIHWINDERNLVKSDLTKSVGAIIGTDFNLNETVRINMEAQFIDVQAYAMSINIRF